MTRPLGSLPSGRAKAVFSQTCKRSLAVSPVLQTQGETPGARVVGLVWWGQGPWPRLSTCGQIWVRWAHLPDRPSLAGLHQGRGPALSSAASVRQSAKGNAELEAGLEPVLNRGLNFTLRQGPSGEWSRGSQLPPPPIRLRLRTVATGLSLCPWRPANLRSQAPCWAPAPTVWQWNLCLWTFRALGGPFRGSWGQNCVHKGSSFLTVLTSELMAEKWGQAHCWRLSGLEASPGLSATESFSTAAASRAAYTQSSVLNEAVRIISLTKSWLLSSRLLHVWRDRLGVCITCVCKWSHNNCFEEKHWCFFGWIAELLMEYCFCFKE